VKIGVTVIPFFSFIVKSFLGHLKLYPKPAVTLFADHLGQRWRRWTEPCLPGLLSGGVPRPAGDRVPWPRTLQLLRCNCLLLVDRDRGAGSVRAANPEDAQGRSNQQDQQVGPRAELV